MSGPVEHEPAGEAGGLYRCTLSRYSPSVLRGIRDHLELDTAVRSPIRLVKAIEEHLREPVHRTAALADLPSELRPVLLLLPYVPPTGWRLEEIRELLRYVGCSVPDKALRAMLGLGFLALHAPNWQVETLRHFDLALNGWEGEQLSVVCHPALANQLATPAFQPAKKSIVRNVRNIRESDGLEFILRVAVLWERIAQSPIRLTQDTTLFKRDKERLASDPVLTTPMFDAPAPIPDIGYLAIVLGKQLNLLVADQEGEMLRAQLGTLWLQGVHTLQRRIWQGLMTARAWSDQNGDPAGSLDAHRLPAKRWAVLLRLASLPADAWLSVTEFDQDMRACDPDRSAEFNQRAQRPFQVIVGRQGAGTPAQDVPVALAEWFEEFLLGAMYQLGAVQVAEDASSNAQVVQLSSRGRWLLGMGPEPPAPPIYEKSLYVQPNHEVVVYRQGLSPELIGQLASFCHWKSVGAALTLELTPESVYRGLELGRTAEEMISILERHSQRPIPPAVVDSMRTWSGRRERLRLYSQCTVLEFATTEDLDAAVERGVTGERLSERLLLVAGDGKVPFDQFRLAGVRDYRHPPTVCVESMEDGITWEVDLARSDLLVERELARFAEPLSAEIDGRLRYRIVPASLAQAARHGLRAPYVREWFKQRANKELPASVELMLQASSRSAVELSNIIVLQTATAAVADGILQHPATKQHIGHRIGPTALVVAADKYEPLKQALLEMGIEVNGEAIGEVGGTLI
jgi:Helicase conserved C-terminal domain